MKRFRLTAIIMTIIMATSFTAPSAALAYYHYYPRYHHHHHWSSGTGWALLGLAGLALLAHKNTNKADAAVYSPQTYEEAKAHFVSKLDDEEAGLFVMLDQLKPNDPGKMYRYYYGDNGATKRRLKKIIKTFPSEYQFSGVSNGYLVFKKLHLQ